jgi:hypothetical protein
MTKSKKKGAGRQGAANTEGAGNAAKKQSKKQKKPKNLNQ